ncbi:nuclear transport factor 2 family protein [Alkalihalobacillus sp. CinArs1]|uniref:nuclear transport factor 2 family protein n=1 Tax=Alkalihalobacillus sp. CinArs1 TaxID=2995314 RepID=UPI0022DD5B3F|nr:nuclear transport factor 2 family protein [Alkalihalobacillus sp. CinArs1]
MQSNKEKAVSLLEHVVAGEVRVAFDKYIAEDFIHHNPYFKGDRESLMAAMQENDEAAPDKVFDVKHVVEDGDVVAVHSHIKQHPEDLGAAVVHLFRFQDGLVVEAWDIGQAVPEDSPNENGVF